MKRKSHHGALLYAFNHDPQLRITQSRNVVNNIPRLPDKSLFSTNAPSKADARKVALELYLQQLFSLRIKDTRDLCEFLRTGMIERGSRKDGKEAGWKEGYLTKRGKNFGGWKTRYFVLRGPVLEYFDTVRLTFQVLCFDEQFPMPHSSHY